MAFPTSPTNGQTYTSGGKIYTYNSTKGVWAVTSNVPFLIGDLNTVSAAVNVVSTALSNEISVRAAASATLETHANAVSAAVVVASALATTADTHANTVSVAVALKADIASPTFTGTVNAATVTLSGELRGPASFTIDPAAVGDNTGVVVIKGDLQVDGTTTTVNSTTMSVADKNIVLASGAANAAAASGAGLTVNGPATPATFTYVDTDDSWNLNKKLLVTGTLSATGAGSIEGLTVGRGAGAVSTNTAVGAGAIAATASGTENTALGKDALTALTSGGQNVGLGRSALSSNTTGSSNNGIGVGSLGSTTTGSYNTSVGGLALYLNTTASNNTAVGYQAAYANTTGANNVVVGQGALSVNTTGGNNTAVGRLALRDNTTADNNTAVGYTALLVNSTGANNVAIGREALNSNTTASNSTAVGYQALYSNTTTDAVVAIGWNAGYSKTTGGSNFAQTYVGTKAGYSNTTGIDNTYIGGYAGYTSTGSYNTVLGSGALYSNTTASNNTAVGYQAGYTNQTGLYNTFIGTQAGYTSNVSGNAGNTCIGFQAGYKLTTGIRNTFIGGNANYSTGREITTGSNNTIIGAYDGNFGGLDIRTASNYIVLSDGEGNPRVVVNGSGNVGIGTTDSSLFNSVGGTTRLAVCGSSATTDILGNTGASISIINTDTTANNTAGLHFARADTDDTPNYAGASIVAQFPETQVTGQYPKGLLAFLTSTAANNAPSEKMRIDSSGNLLIGTTSGNADARATVFQSVDASPCFDLVKYSATTTTSQVFMRFLVSAGAGGNGSITANGASAVTFTAWSDIRLKENIVDLPSQLANIMALRPVEFDYIGYENGEGHQLGFIAQEVQEIYPDLVGEGADGMLTLSDMNKNDARLIKCIQEQQALILALTDRIAALEAK